MTILDWFRPKMDDQIFGCLTYHSRAWWGEAVIPEYCSKALPLQIETQARSDLSPFHSILDQLRRNSDIVKSRIATVAFETYSEFVSEDRKAGNPTSDEFDEYLVPGSPDDIWKVLEPFRITLTDRQSHYNCILCLDVYWPNPHYFVAQLSDLNVYDFYADG